MLGVALPHGQDCGELARFAEAERILSAEPPTMGDIFVVLSPSEQAFTRTGIVECVAGTGSFDGGVGYFRCRRSKRSRPTMPRSTA